MNKTKVNGFFGGLKNPGRTIFTIEHINLIIAIYTCIIGVSKLIRTINCSKFIGEPRIGVLDDFAIPLHEILLDFVFSFILLSCGITLLFKARLSIRFYTIYSILQIVTAFYLPLNKNWHFYDGIYIYFNRATIIAILLLFYFNHRRVVKVLKPKKRLRAYEFILYTLISLATLYVVNIF
jgi:hypothetical protein